MSETPVDPAKRAPATPLARAQAGVTRAMGIAVVVTVALALIGYARGDAMMLEARGWTLGVALLTLGLWVAAAIGDVARRRFASASAIDGGDGVDPRVDAANAILRNTAEQALLAAIAYGALTLLDDHARVAVALFAACFSAGRLLFWSGYRDGAAARAGLRPDLLPQRRRAADGGAGAAALIRPLSAAAGNRLVAGVTRTFRG